MDNIVEDNLSFSRVPSDKFLVSSMQEITQIPEKDAKKGKKVEQD